MYILLLFTRKATLALKQLMYQRRALLLLVLRDPVYHGIATQVAQIAGSRTSNGWLKPTQKHNLTGVKRMPALLKCEGRLPFPSFGHCTCGPPCWTRDMAAHHLVVPAFSCKQRDSSVMLPALVIRGAETTGFRWESLTRGSQILPQSAGIPLTRGAMYQLSRRGWT
jgi:hypothetical protein